MKLLVVVTASPWGGSLPGAALRLVRAAKRSGHEVPAVYFRDDGVYHALRGRHVDGGQAPALDEWLAIAGSDTELLICSAAAGRRIDITDLESTTPALRAAGLSRMWDLVAGCDQVVTF